MLFRAEDSRRDGETTHEWIGRRSKRETEERSKIAKRMKTNKVFVKGYERESKRLKRRVDAYYAAQLRKFGINPRALEDRDRTSIMWRVIAQDLKAMKDHAKALQGQQPPAPPNK
jgi:hypothetical protein